MKKIICGLLMMASFATAQAQSGTKSPYSQYGLGTLSDRSTGFNRAMGGVGQGFRRGNQVNPLNPASYSAVDSLTMLFDVGLSGQLTNYKEGATKVNATTAHFDYAVGQFRVIRNMGVAVGVLPFTNVGYGYSTSQYLDQTNGTISEAYSGSGGLHELFIGTGYRVLPGLSLGLNVGYLWGGYERSVVSSSTSYVNSLVRKYSADVNSYKLNLGVQYEQKLGANDQVVLGLTYGLGHKLGADATYVMANASTGLSDTSIVANALHLPTTYEAGFSWNHKGSLTLGADFALQQWGKNDFPAYNNTTGQYHLQSGLLKDRYMLNVGGEWLPNAVSRNFLKRVRYRVGANYATPYYTVNGVDGPKEFALTAGFGIPLQNMWNNRSVLNVSAQWAHSSAKDLISENTFRVSIGITFNERWFAKWKVE